MPVIQVHLYYIACAMCVVANAAIATFSSTLGEDGRRSSRDESVSKSEYPGHGYVPRTRPFGQRSVSRTGPLGLGFVSGSRTSGLGSAEWLDPMGPKTSPRWFWSQRLKRSRRETVSDQVYVCNDDESHANWSCTCSGCESTSQYECCTSSIDAHLINETVALTMNKNETTDRMTSALERTIKESVARSLEVFCHSYPEDCSVIHLESHLQMSSPSNRSSISPDHVIITAVTHAPATDASRSALLSISLFVLNTPIAPGNHADDVVLTAIPAKFLQKVLLNQSQSLETGVGLEVKSVKVTDPVVGEAAMELPLGSIIAGAVLGVFLVICCIVSAVKAVRDRRLIKARNTLRRDLKQKRHKALQESFRKSPIKKKPPLDNVENGDVVAAATNGASTAASTSQTVQAVVHSGYTSPPEADYSNSRHASSEYLPNSSTEPCANLSGSGDVIVPNGHVIDIGSNGKVIPDLAKHGASDAAVNHIPDTNSEHVTHKTNGVSGSAPDRTDTTQSGGSVDDGTADSSANYEPPSYSDIVGKQNDTKPVNPPGVDNPAYALE